MRASIRQAYLKARLVLHEFVALSPRTMGAIVANSVRLTLSNADGPRNHSADELVDAGRYTGATALGDGRVLAVTFERATLRIEALADSMVRLAWGPGPDPYDVATRDARPQAPSSVDVVVEDSSATLTTPAVRVVVDDRGVTVRDVHGAARYEERTPLAGRHRRVLRRVLRDGERLCGLGAQAKRLDLTGSNVRLWNRDPGGSWTAGQNPLYCSIPITVGLHASGPVWAFHENTYDARVAVGPVDHARHGVTLDVADGALVTYVAVGELDELMTAATTIIGAPAMPPRWALGYHHCRWGWRTQDVVRGVLDGFVKRGLPVSSIHLDIDHMREFRVFTFDPSRFGNMRALAEAASDAGARLVAIVDPAVRKDENFALYTDGVAAGHFVTGVGGEVVHGTVWRGWAAFPDFTRASTRAWWIEQYATLADNGVVGAWHDMNEPTSITLWGDRTLPRSALHDLDGRGGTHAEAHNVYGLLMDRAGYEALATPARRPFVLSRSGWAGLARYAWHWTADVEASTTGLRQQVPTFLGLGLSSVPFTGSDIGGFSGVPSPQLVVRWLELGVVSPLCRTHCSLGSPDREPWSFEPSIEAAMGRLLLLRYRLLPHLYRVAEEAHRLGHPMLRPVDWPMQGGPTGASGSDDALLLGNELLVVPVADPDATSVEVALPDGAWRRRRLCDAMVAAPGHEASLRGGARITLDAPLGQPVILQRAGSIVVLDDAWQDDATRLSHEHATLAWALHVVLDDDGTAHGVGYEDAGDGDGPARHDDYVAERSVDSLVVRWTSNGAYQREGAVHVVVHGALTCTTAQCDGVDVAIEREEEVVRVRLAGPFHELTLR